MELILLLWRELLRYISQIILRNQSRNYYSCYLQVTTQHNCGEAVEKLAAGNIDVQQKRCAAIVSHFMKLDLEKDDIVAFLNDFVIATADAVL